LVGSTAYPVANSKRIEPVEQTNRGDPLLENGTAHRPASDGDIAAFRAGSIRLRQAEHALDDVAEDEIAGCLLRSVLA
jgi:hypothetical protein